MLKEAHGPTKIPAGIPNQPLTNKFVEMNNDISYKDRAQPLPAVHTLQVKNYDPAKHDPIIEKHGFEVKGTAEKTSQYTGEKSTLLHLNPTTDSTKKAVNDFHQKFPDSGNGMGNWVTINGRHVLLGGSITTSNDTNAIDVGNTPHLKAKKKLNDALLEGLDNNTKLSMYEDMIESTLKSSRRIPTGFSLPKDKPIEMPTKNPFETTLQHSNGDTMTVKDPYAEKGGVSGRDSRNLRVQKLNTYAKQGYKVVSHNENGVPQKVESSGSGGDTWVTINGRHVLIRGGSLLEGLDDEAKLRIYESELYMNAVTLKTTMTKPSDLTGEPWDKIEVTSDNTKPGVNTHDISPPHGVGMFTTHDRMEDTNTKDWPQDAHLTHEDVVKGYGRNGFKVDSHHENGKPQRVVGDAGSGGNWVTINGHHVLIGG